MEFCQRERGLYTCMTSVYNELHATQGLQPGDFVWGQIFRGIYTILQELNPTQATGPDPFTRNPDAMLSYMVICSWTQNAHTMVSLQTTQIFVNPLFEWTNEKHMNISPAHDINTWLIPPHKNKSKPLIPSVRDSKHGADGAKKSPCASACFTNCLLPWLLLMVILVVLAGYIVIMYGNVLSNLFSLASREIHPEYVSYTIA